MFSLIAVAGLAMAIIQGGSSMTTHFTLAKKRITGPTLHCFKAFILLISVLLLSLNYAQATTYKVPDDYANIQSAINASKSGDMIWVAQGTYIENLTLKPSVKLEGGFKADYSARNWHAWPSIVDGGKNGSVLIGAQGATLDGFTLRNGKSNLGAGIFLSAASMTIKNNTIEDNTANKGGGGIYITSHPAGPPYTDIENNTIRRNKVITDQGGTGGGIYIFKSNSGIRITKNIIGGSAADGNEALWGGGGISTDQTPIFTIEQNIISHNKVDKGHGGGLMLLEGSPNSTLSQNEISYNSVLSGNLGGGVFLIGGTFVSRNEIKNNTLFSNLSWGGGISVDSPQNITPARIENNFILGNMAEKGAGIHVRRGNNIILMNNSIASNMPDKPLSGAGIYVETTASCIMQNNILWGNGDDFHEVVSGACLLDHNNIEDGDQQGKNGNISIDPQFINYDDLHIQTTSPMINVGRKPASPAIDYDGEARGENVDMGADEIIGEDSICPFVKSAQASYLAPHIDTIRLFRDQRLMSSELGSSTVTWYYQQAPAVSGYLDKHPWSKIVLRLALTPATYAVVYPWQSAALLVLSIMGLVTWRRNKRFSHH
ncbi:MAG: hypothetical protein ACI9C4_001561 [Paraglaciecola sp.]|jgi:hypothetical protein